MFLSERHVRRLFTAEPIVKLPFFLANGKINCCDVSYRGGLTHTRRVCLQLEAGNFGALSTPCHVPLIGYRGPFVQQGNRFLNPRETEWPLSIISSIISTDTKIKWVTRYLRYPFVCHCSHRTTEWRDKAWQSREKGQRRGLFTGAAAVLCWTFLFFFFLSLSLSLFSYQMGEKTFCRDKIC